MFPQHILHALAAELAIFRDRWTSKKKQIENLLSANPGKIVSEIVTNSMYEAINSGQVKLFYFLNKDAQRRIDEIAKQLEEGDMYFIGTAWVQFWPDNRNWSPESIESQLYNTILKEGKFLLIFNMLCRLLFLCSSDISTTGIRKKYQEEIVEYQNKLKLTYSRDWSDVNEIVNFTECTLQKQVADAKLDINQCQETLNLITYYTEFIPSLLSDVDLLTDRHDKVYRILRYIHSLHILVQSDRFSEVGEYFEEWFKEKGIEYQSFIIIEPTAIFPERGIWFFTRNGSMTDFSNLLERSFTRFPYIEGVQVFYNLSEDLRLKMPTGVNTKHQFGMFSSYAYTNVKNGFACKDLK